MRSKAKRLKQKVAKSGSAPTIGVLLYLFLFPLFTAPFIALFRTNITDFIISATILALFILTIKLSKKGFLQEFEYNQNPLTKAPTIPYKMISALLLGFTTTLSALLAGDKSTLIALFLGVIATAGYYLYYGFDPKDDKLENLGDIGADVALQTLKEAEDKISLIKSDLIKITNNSLHTKLTAALRQAELIIDNLKEDPQDIRVARKFLIVYIDGLQKVIDSYVSIDEVQIENKTKERLHSLLDSVQERFNKELKRLKANNHFDLDVQIDVLKEQIKN